MAVRRGTATPSKIYRGTVPVKKVMRGTVEVWSASPYPMSGTWGPVALGFAEVHIFLSHNIAESGSYTLTVAGDAAAMGHRINGGQLVGQPVRTVPLNAGDVVELYAQAGFSSGTFSGTWSIAVEVGSARYTGVHTGPQVQVGNSLTLAFSHTVTQSGVSRIQGSGAWASSANTRQIQVRVNGATVADQSSSTSGVDPVATSADLILAAGDVVELWARHSNLAGSNRAVTPTLTFT